MKPALSAGRVQSVAVRLIVEREREIHAFQTEAAYRITAVFLVPDTDGKLVEMKAELARRIKTKKKQKLSSTHVREQALLLTILLPVRSRKRLLLHSQHLRCSRKPHANWDIP